jgi:hypothetical protein
MFEPLSLLTGADECEEWIRDAALKSPESIQRPPAVGLTLLAGGRGEFVVVDPALFQSGPAPSTLKRAIPARSC